MQVTTLHTTPFTQPRVQTKREPATSEVPIDSLASSATGSDSALQKRLLSLRSRARNGTGGHRLRMANTVLEIAGPQTQSSVLEFLDENQDKPSGKGIPEAVHLLNSLELPSGVQERAAARFLSRLSHDRLESLLPKVALEFAGDQLNGEFPGDSPSAALLKTIDSEDYATALVRGYAPPRQLLKTAREYRKIAKKHNLAGSETIDLALALFKRNQESEASLFFDSKTDSKSPRHLAKRTMDSLALTSKPKARKALIQRAYRWFGENRPLHGNRHLRIGAIAEEQSWGIAPLESALKSYGEGENWVDFTRKLLPQDEPAEFMHKLADGLATEAKRERKFRTRDDGETGRWAAVFSSLGGIAEKLPEFEQKLFLDKALKECAKLEKPELTPALLSTANHWFPDLGYEADRSFIPAVLEDLTSSSDLDFDYRANFIEAKNLVQTMGGTQARETLLKNLGESEVREMRPRLSLTRVPEVKNPFQAARLPGAAVSLASVGLVLSGMTNPIVGGLIVLGGLALPEAGVFLHENLSRAPLPGASYYS